MIRIAAVALAVGAAIVPLPAWTVERWYSRGFYPVIQNAVTPAVNLVPIALLDIAAGLALIGALAWLVRRAGRAGLIRAVASGIAGLVTLAAVLYLLFLLMWGLNYRRVPLEEKLEYDASRITPAGLEALAKDAVQQVNALHAEAHAAPADRERLLEGFAAAQRTLGATRTAAPGVPKRSALEWYFRQAAVDGMTDPFFLEIIVNGDVLPFERSYVLAHEWAHLAGYADESEAGFVAWLGCINADAAARYSAWLAIYLSASGALPREVRKTLGQTLADGPRADLQAMAARYQRSTPAVRRVARETYDAYLRANQVEEGIESYDAVVRLILGSTGPPGTNGRGPRLRAR